MEMADKAGTEPLPLPTTATNNNNNKSISKKDEEEFVVVNPHQYYVVDPTVAVKHSNTVENENFQQQHAPPTPVQNTPSRPKSTMLDDALSRQGTFNNIGYPKGEFDSCSEDEDGDHLPPQPPPQDETPAQENYASQPPPYSGGGNVQRENTKNNIGYPKGEFDSDTDSDDILNDYENFDPTTSLQRV